MALPTLNLSTICQAVLRSVSVNIDRIVQTLLYAMNMASVSDRQQYTAQFKTVFLGGCCLIGVAYLAAWFTQHNADLFSLVPIVRNGASIPDADKIPVSKTFAFHATIYTIWVTIILCLPAFSSVWFVRRSRQASVVWLAFWTMGLFAMLIHQYMAMGILFEWNWQHILHDTVRVTIPIPDLVLTVWWMIDVALGWVFLKYSNTLIHAQRLLLHSLLLVIFLIGFIREGESVLSQIIGIVAAICVLIAIGFGVKRITNDT